MTFFTVVVGNGINTTTTMTTGLPPLTMMSLSLSYYQNQQRHFPPPPLMPPGGYDDHHNFCCSSDSSSSAVLNATTVTVSEVIDWEGGGEGGGKEDGNCINKDGDSVQSILSSEATTMMASVLVPETVANSGDGGMDVQTLAANDGAKRTVLVHVYCWNCATQGRSNDNAGPVPTAVTELSD